MMKMVRRHLERKYVVQEEELLERIADSTERGKGEWMLCIYTQADVMMCVLQLSS